MSVRIFSLLLILSLFLSSCAGEKVVLNGITPPARDMRLLYKFRKDSIRIVTKYEYKNSRDTIRLTKYRLKFDARRFNDSITAIRLMYADSLKIALKQKKIEVKEKIKIQRIKSRWWLWFSLGVASVIVLRVLRRLLLSQLARWRV